MADLQQRRRRSASTDAEAQEEALRQLEMELKSQEVEPLPALKDDTEIPDEETLEKTAVQNEHPTETPRALVPKMPMEAPLFSPAQVAEMEAMQSKAAHLYGGPKVLQGLPQGSDGAAVVPAVPRPKFLEEEKMKELALLSTATGSPSPVDFATVLGKAEDSGPMLQMLLGLYHENQRLKMEALRGADGGPRALRDGELHGGGLPGGTDLHRGRAAVHEGREGLQGRSEHRDGAGAPGGHGRGDHAGGAGLPGGHGHS